MRVEPDAVHIGISGWRYAPWRGVFYPKKLPQRSELQFASRALGTIEINGSFYSLQRPTLYAEWHAATPDDFVFALKGPRYITHMLRLKEIETPLANFLASGVFELGAKLGPILWQFPPQLPFLPDRFERFLELLPHDTQSALEIARHHDSRLDGRCSLAIDRNRRMRHAVEIRHPSFIDPAFIAMLRRHRVALVVADTAGRWPLLEDVTADSVYIRLHGDKELYASGYGDASLDRWAARIAAWQAGGQPADAVLASGAAPKAAGRRDVYCYFDNDVKVHAPYDAARLAARLGLPTGVEGAAPEAISKDGARARRRAQVTEH